MLHFNSRPRWPTISITLRNIQDSQEDIILCVFVLLYYLNTVSNIYKANATAT